MRDTTERPEAVQAGTVKLVGTNREKIVRLVNQLLNNSSLYAAMSKSDNPYGDGSSSKMIRDILLNRSTA